MSMGCFFTSFRRERDGNGVLLHSSLDKCPTALFYPLSPDSVFSLLRLGEGGNWCKIFKVIDDGFHDLTIAFW